MTEPVNINAVPKLNLGLQETDEVFISRGGSGPYRVPASSFPWEQKGDKGDPGGSWAPVLSLVTDGVRRVHRIVGWVGGTGVEPTTTGYIGAAGIVSNVAEAVDVRGLQGNAGWAPVLALVVDGDRRVHQVIDWTGGAGAKPGVGWYVGATGLVELIQDAVNVRGATGGVGWSPVLAVVPDGNRRVQQIVDWIGGAGTKPTALGYVGTSGIVATAALAADVSGAQGNAGWAPVLAIVADGERRVQQVVDWVGGAGTKPATLGYVGAMGIVATSAAAVDVRGPQGVAGWAPVLAVVADGERRVQQVVDWVGGAGTKPVTLGYVGTAGIVATAAAAVDVRGAQGNAGWAPVLAIVADGERRVQQVVDWVGGAGTKPVTLGYVGAAGIVATAAEAVDVRGSQGVAGWAPVLAIVADGERRVQRVVDWTGGAGTKPVALGYVGAAGIVATAAAAVDVRGSGAVTSGSMLSALVIAPASDLAGIGSILSGYDKRWADAAVDEFFGPAPKQVRPVVTWTNTFATGLTTPVVYAPPGVGGGSQATGLDGSTATSMLIHPGTFNTQNGGSSDLAMYGSVQPGGAAQYARWPIIVDFDTSGGAQIEVSGYMLSAIRGITVEIDGSPIDRYPEQIPYSVGAWSMLLTFPISAARRVRMIIPAEAGLVAIRVPTGISISKPVRTGRVVGILGDSWSSATGSRGGWQSGPHGMFARMLRPKLICYGGIGGTGFVAGMDGASSNNYSTRIAAMLAKNPTDLIINPSTNDGAAGTGVQAAVTALFSACSGVARIHVLDALPLSYAANSAACAAACAGFGNVIYTRMPWVSGSGGDANPSASGSADWLWDTVSNHPSDTLYRAMSRAAFLAMAAKL